MLFLAMLVPILASLSAGVLIDFGGLGSHISQSTRISSKQKDSRSQSNTVSLSIALAQSNLDSAGEWLMNVSDTKSPNFSKHWTSTETVERFSPSQQTLTEVKNWLNVSGISPRRLRHSRDRGWLHFNASVSEAEKLLETALPAHIQNHIDFITPTTHLQSAGRKFRRKLRQKMSENVASTDSASGHLFSENSDLPANCSQYTTLDCLRALYNIPTSTSAHPNNSYGIVELAWLSWLPQDLDLFFNSFSPLLSGHRPVIQPIDGGFSQDTYQGFIFNAEADLDFEYAMPLVYPLNVTNFQLGDEFILGTVNNLLAAFDATYCGALDPMIDSIYPDPHGYNSSDCGDIQITNVLSISYANDEVIYPVEYERRQCLEFLKLGLQGVTVIVASADYGVAGQSNQCIDPITGEVNNGSSGHYNPTFPATCPYVTAVGGTQLPLGSIVSDPETAFYQTFSDIISSSGGGFSNVFPRPRYQSNAVQDYLTRHLPKVSNMSTNFNITGRGFPDVAVNAANFVTVIDGVLQTVSGTSASAPVFGSIITKINDARLSVGKRPVGFINPVLYENSFLMNDIVIGYNYGCGGKAFNASSGWDPVTGLGTPNFERLLELYLHLP